MCCTLFTLLTYVPSPPTHTNPHTLHITHITHTHPDRAELVAKRRERVRADSRVQELRSDLRRGLSRLAGPLPLEVVTPLNSGKEEEAFHAALAHLQEVRVNWSIDKCVV